MMGISFKQGHFLPVPGFFSTSRLYQPITTNIYLVGTAAASSPATGVGRATAGVGLLAGVEDGTGAAGLSLLGSVVTCVASAGVGQR